MDFFQKVCNLFFGNTPELSSDLLLPLAMDGKTAPNPLIAYLQGEANATQVAQVRAWMAADPANRSLFRRLAYDLDSQRQHFQPNIRQAESHDFQANKFNLGFWMLFARVAAVFMLIIPIYYLFEAKFMAVLQNNGVAMIHTQTQAHRQAHLHLPGGSEVLLLQDSEISYPGDFGVIDRKVYLQGAASFTVMDQAGQPPLTVHIGESTLEMKNGAFRIYAYEDGSQLELSVDEGELAFFPGPNRSPVAIGAMEQVSYSQETALLETRMWTPQPPAWP